MGGRFRDSGYVDQVVRREKYEQDHPDVRITPTLPTWQAVIPEDGGGETVITCYELGTLLDKLESLDGLASSVRGGAAGADIPSAAL